MNVFCSCVISGNSSFKVLFLLNAEAIFSPLSFSLSGQSSDASLCAFHLALFLKFPHVGVELFSFFKLFLLRKILFCSVLLKIWLTTMT